MIAYTRKRLAEKVAVSGQTIAIWTNLGLIKPNILGATGRGTNRLYDIHNLIECLFVRYFQDHGFSLDEIKRILDDIREFNIKKNKNKPNFYDDIDFDLVHLKFKKIKDSQIHSKVSDSFVDIENTQRFLQDKIYLTLMNLGSIKRIILKEHSVIDDKIIEGSEG